MAGTWVRWSCPLCGVGVGLRARSKAAPMHYCYRKRDAWMPLTKETNDETNLLGGGGPAGDSAGSDARTKAQRPGPRGGKPDHGATQSNLYRGRTDIYSPSPVDVTTFNDVARTSSHLVAYHDKPAAFLPTGGVLIDRWIVFPGAPEYRDALARAGGFGTYADFLDFCEWVIGVHDAG